MSRLASRSSSLATTGGVLLALALGGCGRVVPRGGEARALGASEARPRRVTDPTDLLPSDLDLVVRVDLAAMRRGLGEAASRPFAARAMARAGLDAATRDALERADVVWLGTRLADAGAGDRVLIVASHRAELPSPAADTWERVASGVDGVTRFRSRGPAERAGVGELFDVGNARVFASPVEAPSVRRVLAKGADVSRGEPPARGIASVDVRPTAPSREFMRAHPSLGSLLEGVERVEGVLDLHGGELLLVTHVRCRSGSDSVRLARFLSAFRDAGRPNSQSPAWLAKLSAEANDRIVTVRWPVPTEALDALDSDEPR